MRYMLVSSSYGKLAEPHPKIASPEPFRASDYYDTASIGRAHA